MNKHVALQLSVVKELLPTSIMRTLELLYTLNITNSLPTYRHEQSDVSLKKLYH